MTLPRHIERRRPPDPSLPQLVWIVLAFAAGVATALYWGQG